MGPGRSSVSVVSRVLQARHSNVEIVLEAVKGHVKQATEFERGAALAQKHYNSRVA